MSGIRSIKLLSFAAAVALAACGGGSGGGGGTGSGGTGGSSGPGLPKIISLDPASGPVGAQIRVIGENFAETIAKNRVSFNGVSSPVYEVAPDQTWVTTVVPAGATTGPVTMQIDKGNGFRTIEGPPFTVTDEKPVPVLDALTPDKVTQGMPDQEIVLSGSGFVEASRVEVDGEPVDSNTSNSTTIVVSLDATIANELGTHHFQVINDPKAGGSDGGESATRTLQVVAPLHLLSASSSGAKSIRLLFDRDVGSRAGDRRSYRVSDGVSLSDADINDTNHRVVTLKTKVAQMANHEYTVTIVSESFASAEGGFLVGGKSATFRGFNSDPIEQEVFGAAGCDASSFSGIAGLTLIDDFLYVTEEAGNQVQLVDLSAAPSFGPFLGFDGTSSGLHTSPTTAEGCPGAQPASGTLALYAPRGGVAMDDERYLYVGDINRDRVIRYAPGGTTEEFVPNSAAPMPSPVVLGIFNHELLVATADDKIHRYMLDGTTEPQPYGDDHGDPDDYKEDFLFELDAGGTPALAYDSASFAAYIVDPGHHRVVVYRGLKIGRGARGGSIGAGSDDFSGDATGEPGTGGGEFTNPRGAAVDASGFLYVIDEANGGRLQRFDDAGRFLMSLDLGFLPGGVAADGDGNLWIANADDSTIVRYEL